MDDQATPSPPCCFERAEIRKTGLLTKPFSRRDNFKQFVHAFDNENFITANIAWIAHMKDQAVLLSNTDTRVKKLRVAELFSVIIFSNNALNMRKKIKC